MEIERQELEERLNAAQKSVCITHFVKLFYNLASYLVNHVKIF